jgi:hypothetical protein
MEGTCHWLFETSVLAVNRGSIGYTRMVTVLQFPILSGVNIIILIIFIIIFSSS